MEYWIESGRSIVRARLLDGANSAEFVGAGALSPVPGEVGPLTTTLLLEHVVRAAEHTIG